MSHHGGAAEENVVADGREEFHALLKTILRRQDSTSRSCTGGQHCVILKACSMRTER